MRTLIAYTTKYGATEQIARRIAERLEDATLYDLRTDSAPDLAGFDCVIVGSPLYAGTARKEATGFVIDNLAMLKDKRLGLFFAGMDADKQAEFLANNYPAEVLDHAITAEHIGGIFDPKKTNFAERLIMKAAAGKSDFQDTINDERIVAFVDALSAG